MFPRLLCLCLLLAGARALPAADPKPAPPVAVSKWKETPCVKGRLATAEDTAANRAVFVLAGTPATLQPLEMSLPRCAIWHDSERREDVPVVVIQAEQKGDKKVVGFRIVKGGLGAAFLSELSLLDAPDARFKN